MHRTGTHSRPPYSLLPVIMLVISLLATGCTNGGQRHGETSGEPATVSGEATPSFDISTIDVTDPCTELSAEQLAAVGLGEMVGDLYRGDNNEVMCSFMSVDERRYPGLVSIGVDNMSIDRIRDHGLLLSGSSGTEIDELYTHRMTQSEEGDCSAAVDLRGNRLSVMYSESRQYGDMESRCEKAADFLKLLLLKLGESYGLGD